MQPLSGVTVLDLTRLLPGPFASWLLRSWGARVVKVEDPTLGDYLREVQPLWFNHLNAGAESMAVDLKHPDGRKLFLRLLPQVDMVLEGFRPGVMERLGLSYDEMARQNPAIVLVSLSGYAANGPHRDRAGHDLNYMARSGLLSLMEGAPAFQLGDLTSGLMAAAGGLAAVLGARASGKGTHVQVSILETLRALGSLQALEAMMGLELPRDEMLLGGALPCYRLYWTADGGQVSLAALETKFWVKFCEAVNRPEWIPRHSDPELKEELAALFRSKTLWEWGQVAERHPDACLDPVLRVGQAVEDRTELQPVRFARQRPSSRGKAPGRGQHTLTFLREMGFSEQEILTLAAEGCITVTPAD
ncbi:MAG: CaiB/BaiF CoA transferase family protein [Bacillota bacterium]